MSSDIRSKLSIWLSKLSSIDCSRVKTMPMAKVKEVSKDDCDVSVVTYHHPLSARPVWFLPSQCVPKITNEWDVFHKARKWYPKQDLKRQTKVNQADHASWVFLLTTRSIVKGMSSSHLPKRRTEFCRFTICWAFQEAKVRSIHAAVKRQVWSMLFSPLPRCSKLPVLEFHVYWTVRKPDTKLARPRTRDRCDKAVGQCKSRDVFQLLKQRMSVLASSTMLQLLPSFSLWLCRPRNYPHRNSCTGFVVLFPGSSIFHSNQSIGYLSL